MVTLISQPLGHKLDTSQQSAQIIDDGQGTALVYTGSAHGLSDGDYVYIESNFDRYNGFKYVDSIAYDSFKIRNSENSDAVEYIQDASITFYISILDHGFQCVHLPIVYELESDLSPVNIGEEEYVPTTVVSASDENGYTRLALSQALTNPVVLSKIQLVGDGPLAGAYTIITVYQPWNIVIDLVYSASNDFSGYQIVRYYDNYTINVNVYAGYPTDHRWESFKPFEVAATLKFRPDENNRIKFSIAEILRSYINVRNNLTLDTLPNNTDFSVAFYIGYYESYDESDGEEITTLDGSETIDDLTGYAINAKLPFKSESISFLSDYIGEQTHPARWLTLFDRPTVVVGYFFELSFLNRFNDVDILIIYNGELFSTIENPGSGVIRVPIELDTEGEYCFKAMTTGAPASGGDSSAMAIQALNLWVTQSISSDLTDWTEGATPNVNLVGAGAFDFAVSEILYSEFIFLAGYTYEITVNYTKTYNSGSSNPRTISLYGMDDSFSILQEETDVTPATSTTGQVVLTFVATGFETKIGIKCRDGSNVDIDINTVSGIQTTPVVPEIPEQDITETICIDVVGECGDTITSDEARLTEDDDLRLLE